jgi:hypothetical protein
MQHGCGLDSDVAPIFDAQSKFLTKGMKLPLTTGVPSRGEAGGWLSYTAQADGNVAIN